MRCLFDFPMQQTFDFYKCLIANGAPKTDSFVFVVNFSFSLARVMIRLKNQVGADINSNKRSILIEWDLNLTIVLKLPMPTFACRSDVMPHNDAEVLCL